MYLVVSLHDVEEFTDLDLADFEGATVRVEGGQFVLGGHLELVMHDFGSGLEPVTDDDGDYLYAEFGA